MSTPDSYTDAAYEDYTWYEVGMEPGVTSEPRVHIPEIIEDHKTAVIVSAVGTIGLIAAAVTATHLAGRKDKE